MPPIKSSNPLISQETDSFLVHLLLLFFFSQYVKHQYLFLSLLFSSLLIYVAHVRLRGENMIFILNLQCKSISMWQIWGDKKFLSLIGGKWNGSRHLVFWSLGTLTSLRDRVRDWLRKGKVLAPQIRLT